jgi:NADH:ubiquinone reductase (H+-translocating)
VNSDVNTESARVRPTVVVVGAGFGGLAVVQGLRRAPVDVLLVDEHNYHLFQPLLSQVGTAVLDPSQIAHPVRPMLRKARNADFRLARVEAVDVEARRLQTTSGPISYDYLVLATGSRNNFFGNAAMERCSVGLKDLDDALLLRCRLLEAFEAAAATDDPAERRRLLTFTIVGAGPTGVECAGAISELVDLLLRKDLRRLDRAEVSVVLVEGTGTALAAFVPRLQRAAAKTLERKGIRLLHHVVVKDVVDGNALLLSDGEVLHAGTVIWTAGVAAAPTGALIAGASLGHQGRIRVDADCRVLPDHPEVFAIGDVAEYHEKGEVLPMLAPVAIQQGKHVAATIRSSVAGTPAKPFRYFDKGTMATIGRNAAVVQVRRLHISGFVAWAMWLFVHLLSLVGMRSRIVALITWSQNWLLRDRPVRIISGTGRPAPAATVPGGSQADGHDAVAATAPGEVGAGHR